METEEQKLKREKEEIDKKLKEIKQEQRQRINNVKKPSNVEIRVSHNFNEDLLDINKERDVLGLEKLSKPKLTDLITKHKLWSTKFKPDLKHYMLSDKNNRGQMTFFVFIVIVGSLFAALLLFTSGITVIKIDQALDRDIDLGQVNLQDINNDTFGLYADMFTDNADWWGLATIFGMILGLIISSYIVRNRFPKLGIMLDIFFIFTAFILSLYISSTYQILLDALNSTGETFLEVYTPKTSFFILNLPIFVPIIGVVMMVLFHSSIPQKNDERFQQRGLLQGVQ